MKHRTVRDLLMDDGFLAWFHHTDTRQIDKWNTWIAASEANHSLAEEATAFLASLEDMSEADILRQDAEEIIRRLDRSQITPKTSQQPVKHMKTRSISLFGNYCKTGLRSLRRNKVHSLINITGLSVGMAVAMLIAIWVWDELSYNRYHDHYDRMVQINTAASGGGQENVYSGTPVPLAAELRRRFPNDFSQLSTVNDIRFLMRAGENSFNEKGFFLESGGAELLSIHMIKGAGKTLEDPNSILLSANLAQKLYGDTDPIGKDLRLNNTYTVRVAGIYADLPPNEDFNDIQFIAPWSFFIKNWDWIRQAKDNWNTTVTSILAELAPNADAGKVSQKIGGLLQQMHPEPHFKTRLFCYPMSRWHLYGQFRNGAETGGFIVYVRMFAIIGLFVLLLACINFMNLSTARSERRAREVGIRKTMGSARTQLIGQFFIESIIMTLVAWFFALILICIALPLFNHLAGKQLTIPFSMPQFWLAGLAFSVLTGLIAGSYPALYLSSFQPVKVLKGSFRAGRFAALPRKVLVVLQFTVSVALIIGTAVVFRQIGFARDREVGYNRNGLIYLQETTSEVYKNYQAIHHDLLRNGYAEEMAESQAPITDIWAGSDGFDWQDKPAAFDAHFAIVAVRPEFGKTLGWQFTQGRDFNPQMPTDSSGLILNEAAVRYTGIKDPIGKTIRWHDASYKILGVVKDMVMTSPYQPIPPSVFAILREGGNFINIRLNPHISTATALQGIEKVFKKWDPAAPFDFHFANEEYARKFAAEERIGQLSSVFAALAIFISCLGLFGLAAFMAEQRTREIGVRKVLGATIYNIWQLLSRDFVLLVAISLLISIPLAAFGMHSWLQQYEYRAPLSWWIFAGAGAMALLITLLTVSIQAIRAALANPTRSLRTE